MRTSELATAAAVNAQTLRYYERQGLLAAPDRSAAGYRMYPPDAVRRVRFIKRAQELGFSLSAIHTLLDLGDGGPDSCDQVRSLANDKVDDLRQRMADLQAMYHSLTQLVATCERPRDERECPLLQAIDTNGPEPDQPSPTVELLTTPECPHASVARELLTTCLADLGVETEVVERVGDHPSPTILINGRDVMTGVLGVPSVPACRLDQPTAERIVAALTSRQWAPASAREA